MILRRKDWKSHENTYFGVGAVFEVIGSTTARLIARQSTLR
jgi:hypothetical protein